MDFPGQSAITTTPPTTLVARALALLRGDGLAGRLARGAIWSLAISVVGTCLAFGVQVLLARTAGPAEYGTYAYVLAWMNIALLPAKFDFDSSALRFMGAYRGTGEWSLLRGFLRRSHQIVGALSASIAVTAAVLLWTFRGAMSPAIAASALIACALLPANALLQLTGSALQGLQRVIQAQAPPTVLRPLLFGLGIVAVAFAWHARVSAPVAIGINAAATAAALAVSWTLLRRELPPDARSAPPRYATAEWWRVASGLLVISASQLILSQQADVVVVGSLVGTMAAGHYGAASQLSTLVQFGVTSVLFMATPMIAELYAQNRRADLQRLVTVVGRVNVAITAPVVAGLVVGGGILLRWYGPTFGDAYPVLVVLAASQAVTAMVGALAGFIMSMTGHQNRAAAVIGGSALLNLALTFVLTSMFGLVGTASATLIATVVRCLALGIYVQRSLGISVNPLTSGARPR